MMFQPSKLKTLFQGLGARWEEVILNSHVFSSVNISYLFII